MTPESARRELQEAQRKAREARKVLKRASPRKLQHKKPEPRAKGQREPRVRDRVYLGWIKRLPCVACLTTGFVNHGCHAAHVRAGYPADGWRPTGMQEKPSDRRTLPLCPPHHTEGPKAQHRTNERAWWEARGIHPPALCKALSDDFERGGDGISVLRRAREGIQLEAEK